MKYKKKRYRLADYDYSENGAYFITIVTKNRSHFFGEIENNKMILSDIGKFVEQNFEAIKIKMVAMRIDEYAIMPDHLHLILVITATKTITADPCLEARTKAKGIQPLKKDSVSSFVNHLKGRITRWCNENGFNQFAWQIRFHDRIIRNESSYHFIVNYIQSNVKNWPT